MNRHVEEFSVLYKEKGKNLQIQNADKDMQSFLGWQTSSCTWNKKN